MKLLWLIVIVIPALLSQALLATIGEVTITAKVVTHSPSPTPFPPQSGGGGPSYFYWLTTTPVPAPATTPTPAPTQTPAHNADRPDGTLISYYSGPRVYILELGKKRWIQTADDFTNLGYQWRNIITVPYSEIYPDGQAKVYTKGQVIVVFLHFLSRGSKGQEVKALQQKLKALDFLPATVIPNGVFGFVTFNALKAFQKAHGISPVGYVGPATRAALNR